MHVLVYFECKFQKKNVGFFIIIWCNFLVRTLQIFTNRGTVCFIGQDVPALFWITLVNKNPTYVANGGKTATADNPNGTRANDKARVWIPVLVGKLAAGTEPPPDKEK